MAEFKKGDKVTVREGAVSLFGHRRDPKEVRTVHGPARSEAGAVTLEPIPGTGGGHIFFASDLVPYVETPAPLDPAKVATTIKGGDYIEAESDGAKIGGKVSHVTERGFVAIEHLGEFAIHHITPSTLPKGYRMFALTAHTPAPEPEPEWKPGRFVSVRVNGRELPGERYQGFVTHHGTVMVANEDGSPESINLAHLRDVRPLVVIDPATVDVEALSDVYDKAYDDSSHTSFSEDADIKAGLRAALEHLGIEVPR